MAEHAHDDHHESHIGHVMPMKTLISVFVGLLIFTYITVQQSYFDFGETEFVVTMFIATIKATMVTLFFMHLRYDRGQNSMLLIFTLVFVGLFLAMTLVDLTYYQHEITSYDEAQPVGTPNRQ